MAKDLTTHWLTEDQLAVLVGARTHEVWECFKGKECLSAAEIQGRLGFASKAVYYQLEKLASAGLLIPCGNESARAARFRRVADHVRMPEGFQGERYEKLASRATASKMRKSMRQFQRAAELVGEPCKPDLLPEPCVLHEG